MIDFHTHTVPADSDVVAIVDGRDTWGVHPWHAGDPLPEPDLCGKLAIGECGLDALCGSSLETQEAVLRWQIALSEAHGLPLIVHCVRALDRLLAVRKALRPRMPWMVHGFRGKPQQLHTLLAAGCFVGFGAHYNAESLRSCHLNRLLLETDDDATHDIAYIYNNVASDLGLGVAQLVAQMQENYRAFYAVSPKGEQNYAV